jgi:hypothetical protein
MDIANSGVEIERHFNMTASFKPDCAKNATR